MVWSLMGPNLAEKLERADVVLPASLQAYVLKIWRVWDNRLENVAEHAAIDVAVLDLGGSVAPCGVEDVCDVSELGELGPGLVRVGDVTLDVVNGVIGVPGWPGPAGDAVDLPGSAGGVGEREDLGEAVAHDASDAYHKSHAPVVGRRVVIIYSFLVNEINDL